VLEKTSEFKRFGGPIQLASNALQVYRELDADVAKKIEDAATYTGDKTNGIKDGIRGDWYAKFDLGTPAEVRNMQYTCVVERPDLQQILLDSIKDHVKNGSAVKTYKAHENGVTATLEDGTTIEGDVLVAPMASGATCEQRCGRSLLVERALAQPTPVTSFSLAS